MGFPVILTTTGERLFSAGYPFFTKHIRISDVEVCFVEDPFKYTHQWQTTRDLTPAERDQLHAEIDRRRLDMDKISAHHELERTLSRR